jgi:hypothetical protein
MFMLYGVLAAVVIGWLLGGEVRRLSAVKLHWWPVIVSGLAFQVVLFTPEVAERVGEVGPLLYVGSTVAVLAAVVRNWRLPAFPVIIAGGASNLTAIVANDGYMPASISAMESLGKHPPEGYSNSVLALNPQLPFLTDLFAMPRWLPFANVFSIGDVLITVGVMWAIVAVMRGTNSPTPAANKGVAPVQPSLVSGTESTDGSFAPGEAPRSLRDEGQPLFDRRTVQGKPVVRRGTQS